MVEFTLGVQSRGLLGDTDTVFWCLSTLEVLIHQRGWRRLSLEAGVLGRDIHEALQCRLSRRELSSGRGSHRGRLGWLNSTRKMAIGLQ